MPRRSPAPDPDPGRVRDEPIRILVVDEHPIVGVGLRALLNRERGFAVDAVVDVADAGRILAARKPDVLISELGFGGAADGLDLLRRHVGPPVIFFTDLSHPACTARRSKQAPRA